MGVCGALDQIIGMEPVGWPQGETPTHASEEKIDAMIFTPTTSQKS